MKKILRFVTVCALLIGLTACSFFDGSGGLPEADNKVAMEQMERILSALQDHDSEKLKSLFAQNALVAISDFDLRVAELYDYVPSSFVSMEDRGSNVYAESEYGHEQRQHYMSFDVQTSDGIYRFACKYISIDTKDSDNIGLWSLYVIDMDHDTDPNIAYRGDKQYLPGIHVNEKNVLPKEQP